MAFEPLVNGQAYSWSQITLNILGVPVAGVTSIAYSEEQEITDNFGAGNRVVSRGYGQIATEGSITLHKEEVVALQNAAPGGNLMNIGEFDIPVAYLPENGVIVIDVLRNCRFKSNQRSISRGDNEIEVELPLQISHITWGRTS